MIQRIPRRNICLAGEPGHFVGDVIAEWSCRIDCEVYGATLSAQIQTDATKPIGQSFTAQTENDPKQTVKATESLSKQRNEISLNGKSSPDLNSAAFQVLNTKLRAEILTHKQQPKAAVKKALHLKQRKTALPDVYGFHTSGCKELNKLATLVFALI